MICGSAHWAEPHRLKKDFLYKSELFGLTTGHICYFLKAIFTRFLVSRISFGVNVP